MSKIGDILGRDYDEEEEVPLETQDQDTTYGKSIPETHKEDQERITELSSRADKTVEEAIEISEDLDIAQIAQILSTGPMTSQIQHIMALIPEDRHGCFVREKDGDIFKFQRLNYRVETTDSLPGAIGMHGSGDNRIRVGDVILMTTSKKNKANIQKVEAALVRKKLDMAETEYEVQSEANPLVPIFNEGAVKILSGLPKRGG